MKIIVHRTMKKGLSFDILAGFAIQKELSFKIEGGKMPKSARAKGLDYVREGKRILEGLNHTVEGPGYGVAYYNNRMNPIHRDYFGCFDLISFHDGIYYGHQFTTLTNKSAKIKAIQKAQLTGWVWCRFNDDDDGRGKVGYQVYIVNGEKVIESEMVYGIRRRINEKLP